MLDEGIEAGFRALVYLAMMRSMLSILNRDKNLPILITAGPGVTT